MRGCVSCGALIDKTCPACDGCGTYAGLQKHRRQKTRVCGSCKDAGATYQRELRAGDECLREADRRRTAEYREAGRRLRELFPHVFSDLLVDVREDR